MAERLKSTANILADHPRIGKSGRARDTRELVVAGTSYILIYRLSPVRVEIARIIHGAQDWPPKG